MNDDMKQILDQLKVIGSSELNAEYEIENWELVKKELIQNHFLVPADHDEYLELARITRQIFEHSKEGKEWKYLRLYITTDCNFSCEYCLNPIILGEEKKEPMELQVAQKAIRKFYSNAKAHDLKALEIRFFGGEPCLNWPVIQESINLAEELKDDIPTEFRLNTNGSLLTEAMIDFCVQHEVGITLSLDGTEIHNNAVRHFPSGKGTYQQIINKVRALQTRGAKYSISCVVVDSNADFLNEFLAELQPLGVEHVALNPVLFRSKISGQHYAKKIFEAYKFGQQIGITVEGMWRYLIDRLEEAPFGYCGGIGCEVAVKPDGSFSPCEGVKLRVGNIDDLPGALSSELYSNIASRLAGSIPHCRDCFIEGICAGGCAGNALIKNNNSYLPDKDECDFYKQITKLLLEDMILPGNR